MKTILPLGFFCLLCIGCNRPSVPASELQLYNGEIEEILHRIAMLGGECDVDAQTNKIKHIVIPNCPADLAFLITGSVDLESLEVSKAASDVALVNLISKSPRLKSVTIWETNVSESLLQAIGRLAEVEVVSLDFCVLGENALQAIPNRITFLGLNRIKRQADTAFNFSLLGRFQQLETLSLVGVDLDFEHVEIISQLKNLEQLYVGGAGLTDRSISQLRFLANLRLLHVVDGNFSGRGFNEFEESSIVELSLSRTGTTDAGVDAIARRFGKLETLSLVEPDISEAAVSKIESIDTLKELNLLSVDVSASSLDRLRMKKRTLEIYHTIKLEE